MEEYEVIVVGAGPAGSSAAVELARLDRNLGERVLLLDKAVFPRPKLCAGGLTKEAEQVLQGLGLNFHLRSVPISNSTFVVPSGSFAFHQENQFRIVSREEFDHSLLNSARALGVAASEGEQLESIYYGSNHLVIRTSKGEYRTKILIGADGANSSIRKFMGLGRSQVMMALEVAVPVSALSKIRVADNTAIFDFRLAAMGVPGYCWVFPALGDGIGMVSLGLIEIPLIKRRSISLRKAFLNWLVTLGVHIDEANLKGHPTLQYLPGLPYGKTRVLLAGDAVGVDPLFAEGITSALGLGVLAARCAFSALQNDDFSFSTYSASIESGVVGQMMRRRMKIAHMLSSSTLLTARALQGVTSLKWLRILSALSTGTLAWLPAVKEMAIEDEFDDG